VRRLEPEREAAGREQLLRLLALHRVRLRMLRDAADGRPKLAQLGLEAHVHGVEAGCEHRHGLHKDSVGITPVIRIAIAIVRG